MALTKLNNNSLHSITDGSALKNVAGAVLQVQYNQLVTEAVSQSITALTYAVVDNFPTVTITPAATSSKIKIEAQWFGEFHNDNSEQNHMFFFYRDTTLLRNPTSDTNTYRGIMPAGLVRRQDGANNGSTGNMLSMSYIDTPSSTSAITYKLGVIMNATQQLYINRNVGANNSNSYERGISFISATEIAG